jgi:hypothetical protein
MRIHETSFLNFQWMKVLLMKFGGGEEGGRGRRRQPVDNKLIKFRGNGFFLKFQQKQTQALVSPKNI